MTGKSLPLRKEELTYLIRGASVLGTGGGGSYSIARTLVEDMDRGGLSVELMDPSMLTAGMIGISTAMLGGGLSHEDVQRMCVADGEPPSLRAARALSAHLGLAIDFVFPIEIGPQNTMEAVRLAALLGVPILDGDCAGRAIPELQQTTLSLRKIPLTPVVIATFQGDLVILSQIASDHRGEALLRGLATSSGNLICIAGFPVSGDRLSQALIPGTLTLCLEMGRLCGTGGDPAAGLAALGKGRVAFRGKAESLDVGSHGGFFKGRLSLRGTGPYEGEVYRIGIQNEFMWSWRDEELDISCPDLVCVVNTDSGLGKVTYGHDFENAIQIGEDLTVLHLPCDPMWRSREAEGVFPAPGPAVMGGVHP